MKKTALWWVAAIFGAIICLCAAAAGPFGEGVQQSDTCTTNKPDHFMCRMFGNDE